MSITILNYKTIGKGSILGIFNVFIPQFGLEIYGLTHFKKDSREWVNLPSREITKDEEKKWVNVVRFKERSSSDAFQRVCLQSIKDYHLDQARNKIPQDEEQIPF